MVARIDRELEGGKEAASDLRWNRAVEGAITISGAAMAFSLASLVGYMWAARAAPDALPRPRMALPRSLKQRWREESLGCTLLQFIPMGLLPVNGPPRAAARRHAFVPPISIAASPPRPAGHHDRKRQSPRRRRLATDQVPTDQQCHHSDEQYDSATDEDASAPLITTLLIV